MNLLNWEWRRGSTIQYCWATMFPFENVDFMLFNKIEVLSNLRKCGRHRQAQVQYSQANQQLPSGSSPDRHLSQKIIPDIYGFYFEETLFRNLQQCLNFSSFSFTHFLCFCSHVSVTCVLSAPSIITSPVRKFKSPFVGCRRTCVGSIILLFNKGDHYHKYI